MATKKTPKETKIRAGRGKKSFELTVLVDRREPSRSASLRHRATWAIDLFDALVGGEKVSRRQAELAAKWLREGVAELVGPTKKRVR